MSSQGQQTILTLAEQYGLQEGKNADYYLCHSTWVLTKTGAEKIKQAEEIKHSFPVPSHCPDGTSVAYLATFTSKEGKEEHEIGSCRTDGTVNNPAKTHSHEMAIKRLKVRGILAIVAPAGQVYGIDELTDEYRQHGNGAITDSAPQPVAQPTQNPTVQELTAQFNSAPQPATNPDKTIDYSQDPRLARARQAEGWKENYLTLPQEWTQQIDRLQQVADIQPRDRWERLIVDHIRKHPSKNGEYKQPTTDYFHGSYGGYRDFSDLVFRIYDYQGNNKSLAWVALKTKDELKLIIDAVISTGQFILEVPDDSKINLVQHVITKRDNNAPIAESVKEIIDENKDEIAQASPETRFDDVPPKQVNPNGNMDDVPF